MFYNIFDYEQAVKQLLSAWYWDACSQLQHAEDAPDIVKIGIFADTFSLGAAGDWFSGPSSLFGAISHLPYISTSPPLSRVQHNINDQHQAADSASINTKFR